MSCNCHVTASHRFSPIHPLFYFLDTVTGMSLSPDGKTLLSNGMDNTVRAWDTQAFVAGDRMLKVFLGALACRLFWRPVYSVNSRRKIIALWFRAQGCCYDRETLFGSRFTA